MKPGGQDRPGGQKRGNQVSRMAEACLRISRSLDHKHTLQEVIDSARSLTDARYGALVVFDPHGAIKELLTSGLTAEEQRRLKDLPQGRGLLGYLNEVREPLRLDDIAGHPRSVGFPQGHPPMKTFLGVPILHTGDAVGNIYLTEKAGGQGFTQEDEDTLVLFASHAAVVINNARTYEQVKRAKADLEALINISPVGVMVFDAKSGDLLSRNEETRRIVGKLNAPGRSLSQLLKVMTLRTANGRDIPLAELPTSKALRSGETVLAEEVVVHLPNGREVHTIVNARPIYGQGGDAVSVVTTMQDVTPLEELKRQRAAFLSRVSQELRTPLTSIKGSAATILSSSQPLDATEVRQFLRIIDEQADRMRHLINNLVDITHIEAGTLSVTPEPMDLEHLVREANDAIAGQGASGHVEVDLAPDLPRVMADRRRMLQVLGSLLEAAFEHTRNITISASPEDLYVAVTVGSAGGGPPAGRPPHQPNGSSGSGGEDVRTTNGGDGLDLAVCRGIVKAHGGRMSAESDGLGLVVRFRFTIPVVDEIAYGAGNRSDPEGEPSRTARTDQGRILAVGGDPEGRRYVRRILVEADFTPVVTDSPDEMERLIEMEKPHLVIVESMLSPGEGFSLMERVRRVSDAPVIFVSGHGGGQNIERAFEFGVADYVVKPFTPTELVARINAALRRRRSSTPADPVKPFMLEDLSIDYAQRRVTVAGHPVQLTATEYRLLSELSAAAGQVLTYEQLLRRVWGPLYSTDTRIVHTYVKQLRSKLGDDARRPRYIFTEPRVGCHMARPAAD